MRRKKVLIDLSILKNINCGLGQIALNYGRYFQQNYKVSESSYDLYLLVPKSMSGAFGGEVRYITVNWFRKHFMNLMPVFDVWHSIHQLSRFMPSTLRTKYLLTIHDFNFMYEKEGQKQQRILRKIQRKFSRASSVVCISSFARSEVNRYLQLDNKYIDVIYNGVESLDNYHGEKPQFVEKGKSFFFTIGEIKEKKNFQVLVPMMKYFPDKVLYIAGNDTTSHADFIRKMIESEGADNVKLVGTITNEERVWLYAHCEAFLFPSLFEGFGLPVIEAMLFGRPVFSSQETSLKEIGGECAFFWTDFEPEKMSQLIVEKLDEFNASNDLSEKNRLYAQSFGYEKHMQSYQELYKELLKA